MRYALLVLTCSFAVGCGSSADTPELSRVAGTVTRGGKPVNNLEVVFQPSGGGRASTGRTDEDGKFTLQYTREEPGAIPGSHTVYVRYLAQTPEEEAKPPQPYGAIVAKYGTVEKSTLKVDVEGDVSDMKLEVD